ncbi:GAF and ANTAR domain-containing protein [Dactylosporangium aurantiacum]|uniref:GAF and ANTAR domain-containing protein n=1 Tax=Dactylosporangium aurantiacum TaxID=35754 RepID=A0A9Q9MG98_9ACTN|nr:GAF and ANTAR domain-containing protein [Dactylosporangium aurantiacum]MDG6107103.1 GAF and ANTAR domain-containing protein [Dactylosporangium aurantiacum]UWZ51401.1 GAF and ANTAR domain-containing protein [Dactylosporangium aurantiacum]
MNDPSVELASRMGRLAQDLHGGACLQEVLQGIVDAAVQTVPHAEHAGVTLRTPRQTTCTPVASDDFVRAVDQLQYDLGEGPCLSALFDEPLVRMPDVTTETRWPAFTARARKAGPGSMLSFRLVATDTQHGGLNLYAEQPGRFDELDEHIGLLFAAHAAGALGGLLRREQLSAALSTHDTIGQAKGILVERYRINSDAAFQLLVRASQHTNTKLAEIADHLVRTGELRGPSFPDPPVFP